MVVGVHLRRGLELPVALLGILLSDHSVVHDPAAIVWHAHPRSYRELEQRVWGYGIGLTACLLIAINVAFWAAVAWLAWWCVQRLTVRRRAAAD